MHSSSHLDLAAALFLWRPSVTHRIMGFRDSSQLPGKQGRSQGLGWERKGEGCTWARPRKHRRAAQSPIPVEALPLFHGLTYSLAGASLRHMRWHNLFAVFSSFILLPLGSVRGSQTCSTRHILPQPQRGHTGPLLTLPSSVFPEIWPSGNSCRKRILVLAVS